jgi:hypothetical protein
VVKLQLPSLLFVRDSNYNTFREKIVNFACQTLFEEIMTFQGQQQKPRQKGYQLVQQQDHRSLALKVSYANYR